MTRLMTVVLALTVLAGSAQAQARPRGRFRPETLGGPGAPMPQPGGANGAMPLAGDTMPGDMQGPGQGPRAQMLRAQVEERFGRMVQADLELTDEQMQQVRQAIRANQDRRIALTRREQDLRREIGQEMQRGGSANGDSVARMTDAMSRLRVERAQSDDQLVKDLAFLPPVKRARLLFMMQRLEQRIQEIRQRSQMGARRGIR